MQVIDTKTSDNIILSRPWVHENIIVSSSYYQSLKYLECGIERKIVVDDNPFTEVETHFGNAKFFLKGYVVKGTKSNDVKSIKSDKLTSKRIDAVVGKEKVDTKQLCPILNKRKIMFSNKKLTSGLLYVPKIDAINLALKVSGKSITQNQVRDVALPTKHTREGFDPNAYKLFVKVVYNSNEPSMLGKLPSEETTRKARKGLGNSQPPPIHISIRRELKAKAHIVEHEEDEESVGSSYHVTIHNEHDALPKIKIDEELEDIVCCCHISVNERKMLEMLHQNLKKE
ncbi:hypothetical protein KY289_001349 [Solanum tuberosum]|nr:hypothetical protein KY289_001349 [Solanum tuberosum]